MTDEEKTVILTRAAELRDELMGVGLPVKTPGSEPGEVEAASTPPANLREDCDGQTHYFPRR